MTATRRPDAPRTHRLINHYRLDPAPEWRPLPSAELREQAWQAALLLAGRLVDAERLTEAIRLCPAQTQFPQSLHWDPASLAQGDLGLALLCGELAALDPEGDWARHGERFAGAAAASLRHRTLPMGAISGASGVTFVAQRLGDTALRALAPELDGSIAQQALATAASIRGQRGLSVGSFDQISGLAGVLLCALPTETSHSRPVAPFVIRALAALAESDQPVPAWFTPPERLYDDDQRHAYPYGNLNLGLAHGIPGPLAALALSVRCGLGGDPARTATAALADWLASHVTLGEQGPGWDTVVPLVPAPTGLAEAVLHDVGRDAWCYGTPGAARALFLAGAALGRADLRNLAIEAMAAVYRRAPAARGIDAPTFCHGVAGLLQVTLRFAHDTGLPLFTEAADALTRQVVDAVEPDRVLGVANLEPNRVKVDQPGVLDGAAGVALVLLGAATGREPTWDRLFGLS